MGLHYRLTPPQPTPSVPTFALAPLKQILTLRNESKPVKRCKPLRAFPLSPMAFNLPSQRAAPATYQVRTVIQSRRVRCNNASAGGYRPALCKLRRLKSPVSAGESAHATICYGGRSLKNTCSNVRCGNTLTDTITRLQSAITTISGNACNKAYSVPLQPAHQSR